MQFTSLIGLNMKADDAMLEVLNHYDIDVRYDFDRSHENIPDIYWMPAMAHGFCLRANEKQVIDTVFIYVQPGEGYTAISREEIDIPAPNDQEEARNLLGPPDREGVFNGRKWSRFAKGVLCYHYTWNANGLAVIAIMMKSIAP